TPEHIESHGGFENYKRAKGELFESAKTAIINLDDENAEYFSELCKGKKYGYSVESGSIDIATPLPGKFNLYNALAAAYVGLSQGVDMKVIKETLGKAKGIPGRMETVIKEPFPVIVDYAHTPDALEKVYKTVKGRHKLVCVLGAAGGGRDKWKRPQMGKIAARYCDEIILTNEDPYNEDPGRILAEIKSGISSPISKLYEILDRREAIKKALRIAKRGDIVVVTGKGAEPWLMTNEGRVAWDDREIVRAVYREIFG
ncbi:MAG TPA: UDP-N-acetylmuramoyl-L-alanyl-D-glutamate--2,6-diaminopimelate ligase, partial [Gemmatimonadetes bacterium]|nr:UDP-N-acetylmuramoyl-L-alanyl-D-glutamate--2,6-diaminopimelate ligase [Gemmatimonadota bacterium]